MRRLLLLAPLLLLAAGCDAGLPGEPVVLNLTGVVREGADGPPAPDVEGYLVGETSAETVVLLARLEVDEAGAYRLTYRVPNATVGAEGACEAIYEGRRIPVTLTAFNGTAGLYARVVPACTSAPQTLDLALAPLP